MKKYGFLFLLAVMSENASARKEVGVCPDHKKEKLIFFHAIISSSKGLKKVTCRYASAHIGKIFIDYAYVDDKKYDFGSCVFNHLQDNKNCTTKENRVTDCTITCNPNLAPLSH